jgi:hypothetical protein
MDPSASLDDVEKRKFLPPPGLELRPISRPAHSQSLYRLLFENRVLIFASKRDGVMGGWRKLHNEELHNLYCSPSIIRMIESRRMRWAGHVARMGEKRNAYRILVGKPEGKRPLVRPRCRWVDYMLER